MLGLLLDHLVHPYLLSAMRNLFYGLFS